MIFNFPPSFPFAALYGEMGGQRTILYLCFLLTLFKEKVSAEEPTKTNLSEIIDFDLLNWPTPPELQKLFPFYLCGYDKDGSPVWYVSLGKWKYREALDNPRLAKDTLKYTTQAIERVASPELVSLPGHVQTTFTAIVDLDGYGIGQLAHIPSVQTYLAATTWGVGAFHRKNVNINRILGINCNFAFLNMFRLMKPLLGSLANKIEIYGTNPDKWKPLILAHVPRSQLPPNLGGFSNHTFLQSYD